MRLDETFTGLAEEKRDIRAQRRADAFAPAIFT
jgi:hypothetical protein